MKTKLQVQTYNNKTRKSSDLIIFNKKTPTRRLRLNKHKLLNEAKTHNTNVLHFNLRYLIPYDVTSRINKTTIYHMNFIVENIFSQISNVNFNIYVFS
jgi:hypothetical protein